MSRQLIISLVVPGWSALNRRRPLAVALLVLGVLIPVFLALYVMFSERNWVALTLDTGFLALVVVVGAVAVIARIVAIIEVWLNAGRPFPLSLRDGGVAAVSAGVLTVTSLVVIDVGEARSSLAPAFVDAGDGALFDADAPTLATVPESEDEPFVVAGPDADSAEPVPGTLPGDAPPISVAVPIGDAQVPVDIATTTTTTLPPLPATPDSGVDRSLLADVTTVLLIGGDAGPGRWGLRTDSMMLFSLHHPSGRASLVSIPRDMRRILFPPGSALEQRYPYGYTGLTNAVYVEVQVNRGLRSAYAVDGVRPGVVALAHAIGYSLDVTIDDYVLVDMQGFLDLVDAIGGVTILLTQEIPMPGNVPGARSQYPDVIGPGVVEMDGTMALGYARSRKGDSDYHRTRRQRDLLASLATQVSLSDVVASFPEIAAAVGGTLRTSLTPDELAETLNVIGGQTAIVESVGLVPPLANVRNPNFDELAKVVGAVHLALVTGERSGY